VGSVGLFVGRQLEPATKSTVQLRVFAEEQRSAQVYLGAGETVEQVMHYHYPNCHKILSVD